MLQDVKDPIKHIRYAYGRNMEYVVRTSYLTSNFCLQKPLRVTVKARAERGLMQLIIQAAFFCTQSIKTVFFGAGD